MDKEILKITKDLMVLYVEDDADVRKNTTALLKELFQTVDVAQDGKIGLNYFEEHFKKIHSFYDLVITDIQMPHMDGVTMVEKIYQLSPEQNVLVFSAYNDSKYLEKFIDLGVDGFVKKPLIFNNILQKIKKVCLAIQMGKQQAQCILQKDQLNQELEIKVAQRTQKLEMLVKTDTLTGYSNRYKLNLDIQSSINPALAIINIDNFSQLNDFYGHEKGDLIIQNLGKLISDNISKNNGYELYHLQGDEFVIYHQNVDQKSFLQTINTVSDTINIKTIDFDEEKLYIQVSTSISFEKKEKILITANMAKKVAKRENISFIIYDKSISLDNEYQNNLQWVKKIKVALGDNRFIPVFQPIVNNTTNTVEKYESLVRLQDHDTLFAPNHFLDISKQTKQYLQITKIMLLKSFETFKDDDVEFSINLTIEDILHKDITDYIFDLLEKYKIGNSVVFEIVESEYIQKSETILSFIEKIHSYGCKIAIDDFGTGYSNFEYLLKIKADYIKIDGSLIKDIDTNLEKEQVVSTIVEFSKKMGMKTIAEFVENESVLNKVKMLGIDYSQGYYLGKPSIK